MMKYTFKNGATIEGSLENILSVAKALKETVLVADVQGLTAEDVPSGYYLSQKEGLVKLKNMNSMHLRNALKKRSIEYLNKLSNLKNVSDNEYLSQFTMLSEDKTIVNIFEELSTRA